MAIHVTNENYGEDSAKQQKQKVLRGPNQGKRVTALRFTSPKTFNNQPGLNQRKKACSSRINRNQQSRQIQRCES